MNGNLEKILKVVLLSLMLAGSAIPSSALSPKLSGPDSITRKKNFAFYGLGLNYFYFSHSLSYERLITARFKINPLARLTYTYFVGKGSIHEERGDNLIAQLGILTGRKKHHLEMTFGAGQPLLYESNFHASRYNFSAGYRYTEGPVMVNVGLAYPLVMYTGIGFTF